MRIREANAADADVLGGIHVRAWQAAYRGQLSDEFLDELSVDDRAEQWRSSLQASHEGWRTWVADVDGRPVGWATTGPSEDADADPRTAELYAIYLEPERVGTGVGRRLFEHAVGDLRDRGFGAATLWVLETNDPARRFYEAAGWSFDGTITSERVDCEMRPTVRYRTDL
ncbi:MAG: GNAT family N-acetyltransferase [Actinobacteria bacterium]|nr:GNAT family N-acetyltransferase [Actinomycetota bacterium]